MLLARLFLLVALLVCPRAGLPTTAQASALPLPLASITTRAQAEAFVQSRTGYQAFHLLTLPATTRQEPFLLLQPLTRSAARDAAGNATFREEPARPIDCNAVRNCLGSPPRTSWWKADFDGNGRLDLLVSGYLGERLRLVSCFLDLAPGQVREEVLMREYGDRCLLLQVRRLRGQPVIERVRRPTRQPLPPADKPQCQVDTLLFRQTGFIEYQARPKDYRIESIAFRTTQCFGRCPVFSLQVNQQRQMRYEGQRHVAPLGVHEATLAPRVFQELWDLVNYTDFPLLPDLPPHLQLAAGQYLDLPVYSLSITYANGQVKTLGHMGTQAPTLGLQQVYDRLLALQQAQPWH